MAQEREPINAYQLGATRRRGEQYQCSTHKRVDCETCFDWVKMVRAEAEGEEKTKRWLEKRQKWADKVDD